MAKTVPIVIPAAGASSRMRGADKLMMPVAGQPCLRTMAERALETGQPVIVTLPGLDHPRTAVLAGLNVTTVPVPDASLGMSRSLIAALPALPDPLDGMMILPADMPDLTARDLALVLDAFEATEAPIVQATCADGTPGHPVVFAADFLSAFHRIQGDQGARAILAANRAEIHPVALKGRRARTDLDTPEDWAVWSAAQSDP